ncbi:MAG: hypothetical protein IT445_03320 [Phycisphaeraceae bacterium]|nr:hypothetical protein [Phycisphaeraceae bacterium]
MQTLRDVAAALPGLKDSMTGAADWLANSAQVKSRDLTDAENRAGHEYKDWRGAFRGECLVAEGIWWFFCPMWHGGQAVKALLKAYAVTPQASWLKAAVLGGDFICRHQIDDELDKGLLLAYEDFSDKVTVSAVLESLDGLVELGRHTNNEQYVSAAIKALQWCAAKAWIRGEGLVRDLYDPRTRQFVHHPYPSLPGREGRPLADDAVWLSGAKLCGDSVLRDIFYEILGRLLTDETPTGNWADYCPCHIKEGWIHPRHAYWWGRPFLAAWRDTHEQMWLDAAVRAGEWYRLAQRIDGGLFRNTDLRFNSTSFGQCTSGAACAAIFWIELFCATGDRKWLEPIHRSLQYCMSMQLHNTTNHSTRGAMIEGANSPDGSDQCPYFIRDLASIFFVQAAATLLNCCTTPLATLQDKMVDDTQRYTERPVTK